MKKQVICILLVVLLCITTLVACSSKQPDPDPTTENTQSTAEPTTAESETTEPTDATESTEPTEPVVPEEPVPTESKAQPSSPPSSSSKPTIKPPTETSRPKETDPPKEEPSQPPVKPGLPDAQFSNSCQVSVAGGRFTITIDTAPVGIYNSSQFGGANEMIREAEILPLRMTVSKAQANDGPVYTLAYGPDFYRGFFAGAKKPTSTSDCLAVLSQGGFIPASSLSGKVLTIEVGILASDGYVDIVGTASFTWNGSKLVAQ
jgi:hypothetical protein